MIRIFRNCKKTIRFVKNCFLAGLLLLLIYFLTSCSRLISINEPFSYKVDDLKSLFQENRDDFQEIAQIFLDNDEFWEKGKIDRHSVCVNCYDESPKQYFSSENWEKVSQFFKNTKPTGITRYQYDIICFDYNDENLTGRRLSFYYCIDPKNVDLSYHAGKYEEFTKMGDGWYFGDDTEHVVDDLKRLFKENRDDFQEIAQIFLDNEFWEERQIDQYSVYRSCYDKTSKHYFSSEDWEKVSRFFKNTKSTIITRYQYDIICFNFNDEYFAGNRFSFYYCLDPKNVGLSSHAEKYVEFTNMGDGWYFGNNTY